MTTSFQQPDYLTISSDDIVTISNTIGSSYYTIGSGIGSSSGNITISNGGTGYTSGNGATVTIGSGLSGAGTGYEWSQTFPVEWVDGFPEFDRIKKMCEQYPALKIAYEKFVTTYKLIKDHYDTPEDQRPLP